jgi:peptidyl-dipeptidase Dcp
MMLILVCVSLLLVSATPVAAQQSNSGKANPFLSAYNTPFATPPFDRIRNEHYLPAIRKGMEEEKREIEAIIINPQQPSFQNTIEALDLSGLLLERVRDVLFGLVSANTSDEIQAIATEVTPLLSQHRDDINLNDRLFQRVRTVYEKTTKAALTPEQAKLLEDTYQGFVRGGANLSPSDKERFRNINEELSSLSLKSTENVLKETNAFKLILEDTAGLAGLPQSAIDAAAESAKKLGKERGWVFTLQKPSMIPFLQYAENRVLREKLFTAYIMRGDQGNEYDNKATVARIAALRVERARLLGYATHADFVLERNMARTPATVYEFLNKLWQPALKNAEKERDILQATIAKAGGSFKLEPWDWWYYAEQLRKSTYDLDENELRPYFQLENVRRGAFEVAGRLYGLRFVERRDIPTYSDEVVVFEVQRKDGSHVGILYTDYFPRPGKRAGAWCGGFRTQEIRGDSMITPLVTNVGNFSRPAGEKPALLSSDEVRTLFHEFGHALQSLLSHQTYRSLSLPVDFVELPSQIMENWAFEPEVLALYARHYATGEVLPQSLVEKITRSARFNQGFITVEYLSACFLDMDWHTLKDTVEVDVRKFEKSSLDRIGLIPEIVVRYRSPFFSHIWSSMYAAGYYSYIWAAVLDADAFEAFREKGLFDQITAAAFAEFVLARGTTDDAMKQYERFRGRKPAIEPLLRRRGLL